MIVPILLRPCDWYSSPLATYFALPSRAKPITTWDNREEAFTDIVAGLRRAIESLQHTEKRLELPAKHTGRVNAIAVTPDARQVVSAGADGLAIVWNGFTLKPTRVLAGDRTSVVSVQLSRDGKRLATASRETLELWGLAGSRPLLILQPYQQVTAVAFSDDGQRLLSGSLDGIVKVWDAENGQLLSHMSTNTPSVTSWSSRRADWLFLQTWTQFPYWICRP